MARLGPGVVVTGLTLGALGVVGLLAAQADGAQNRAVTDQSQSRVSNLAPDSATPSPGAAASPAAVPALPAGSGTGRRVVYSVGSKAVWLVDPKKNPQVQAAFTVQRGSVDPAPGTYAVFSRSAATTGGDGRQVEHVVRFTQLGGVVIGFSAAVDGSTPAADPTARTGGIRETRQDAQSLWDFAPTGTRVTVVP
ncbi:hypothetical protein ACIGXM_00790 [Kitasatospora sp. NPDC052896]|uniref:hypothetical protein n=1 Tax=Kitasatospora sp. NPDC052896 TaxID=3364061 RepID=UPI0037C826A0